MRIKELKIYLESIEEVTTSFHTYSPLDTGKIIEYQHESL